MLFDGEEEGPGCPNARFAHGALRGSRAYVAAHRPRGRAMVLLDYVANKGVRLPREGSSDPRAVGAPARRGEQGRRRRRRSRPRARTTISDDHTPFLRAGIPAVDLIDFAYRCADGLQDTSTSSRSRAWTRWARPSSRLVGELGAA